MKKKSFAEKHLYLYRDLWDFLKVRKKFWLLPLMTLLLLLGLLIIFAETSAIAGFIYMLV